jgi:thiamine pyrophosphate-dependent acetolactate synthase large subunit-like protein
MLASSMGVAGFTAGDAPSLERAIDDALAVDGPSLIDVRIDRSNYGAMMKAIRGS